MKMNRIKIKSLRAEVSELKNQIETVSTENKKLWLKVIIH